MHSHPHDRQQVEQIKRALSDPRRLAEFLGLTEGMKPQARGVSVRCPLHAENNPSCSITAGEDGGVRVRCFAGCDFGGPNGGGDELNLVAAVNGLSIKTDFPEVLRRAALLAGVDLGAAPAPRPVARPPLAAVPRAAADLGVYWDRLAALDADGWEYLKSRGLEGAAALFRTMPTGGLLIPGELIGHEKGTQVPFAARCKIAMALRDAQGRVVGIQARTLGAAGSGEFRIAGSSTAGVFGDPAAVEKAQNVVICEGMTDTAAATIGFAAAQSTAVVGIAGVENAASLWQLSWKGKRVFHALDADAPGTQAATACAKIEAQIVEHVTKGGGRPIRLRPEGAKDLAAMHAAGVDLYAFAKLKLEQAMGFGRYQQRMEGNRARRLAIAPRLLRLGVPLIDAAFGGARPTDRILFGAKQGAGKTEIATIVATSVARRRDKEMPKRVHFFALEADEGEIEERIKWRLISGMAWDSIEPHQRQRLNFTAWGNGLIDDLTGPWEEACDRLLTERYPALHTYYRKGKNGFTPADMTRIASDLRGETDLIILDHLHFIDIADENENRGMKRLLQAIDAACEEAGAPLVLLAHLKKLDRKGAPLVPQLDDFRGTSDIGGIMKRAVTIAPALDQQQPEPHLLPTYMRIVKNRPDGSRSRYVGLCHFDVRSNSYSDGYTIGRLVKNETKFEACTAKEIPPWAIGTANPPPLLRDVIAAGGRNDGDDDDR